MTFRKPPRTGDEAPSGSRFDDYLSCTHAVALSYPLHQKCTMFRATQGEKKRQEEVSNTNTSTNTNPKLNELSLQPSSDAYKPTVSQLAKDIGPSPIFGYKLVETGLIDMLVKPSPQVLTFNELKNLINTTSKMEGTAKHSIDNRLGGTSQRMLAEGFSNITPVLFFMGSLYLIGYRGRSIYYSSVPAQSVLLRRGPGKKLSQRKLEEVCQRRRVLLTATTPSMLAYTLGGALTFFLGLKFLQARMTTEKEHKAVWESKDDLVLYEDVTRDAVLYYNHTELVLKWLFAVYFHHPAYRQFSSAEKSLPPCMRKTEHLTVQGEADLLLHQSINRPRVEAKHPLRRWKDEMFEEGAR